jgi:PAS domain S-box-containing protein
MIQEKVFNPQLAADYKVILDSTSDLICAFDKEYRLAYCSQSFKKTFEVFVNEPLDENKALDSYIGLSRFIDLETKWKSWLERAFAGESFREFLEHKIIGKKIIYSIEFKPVKRNNEVAYIQIAAREETLKKNYEELLRHKQEKPQPSIDEELDKIDEDKEQIIKERDDALELLIESAEQLQIVMQGSNDGFWDWNLQKDQLFLSAQYYEILGYRNGEIKSDLQSWQNRIHEDDIDFVLDALHAHLEDKTKQYKCEYRVKTKKGSWKWILDRGKVAVRDENSNPLRVAGTISDIDERKKTVKELQESESKFVSMAENLPVMIWLTDKRVKPQYINKKGLEFIGEKYLDKELSEIVHTDDLEFLKYNLIQTIRQRKTINCELRFKDKNGEYRWILTNLVPRLFGNDFIGILGVGLDITERKEIETRLMESETQFNEITSVIGDGIFMMDGDGKVKFANPEFTNLLGYRESEIEGVDIHSLIHNHDDSQNFNCPLKNVFNNGDTVRIAEDYFITKYDQLLPVSYVVSPLKRNDSIVGCVVAFHDITERLNSEEEMQRFVEELQFNKELMEENAMEFARLNEKLTESESQLKETNNSKDKFFSIISHDLRSPFTSIIGFAEVMLEDLDILSKNEIKEFTSSIYKSSKNIQNLLENLLQWSRVQTGRIEFNPIKFDLSNLINDVVALYQVNAARKKITLTNELEKDFPIVADKFMIDAVLRNLVSNSIKFTRQGGEIKIGINELPEEGLLQVAVSDNGVGMKDEVLAKLFKIDEHITTKGTEKEKGTGLGLILCKEFIEKHNGKIWAESTQGEESKFKFTIPNKL